MPRASRFVALLCALGLAASAVHAVAGKAVPIVPDGTFGDWKKASKFFVDPEGDADPGLLDLGRLQLANDNEALYLRLDIGSERLIQNSLTQPIGNQLRLYIDVDAKRSTGFPVENLGAEIEIRFGEQEVIEYDKVGNATHRSPGEGAALAFPTFSANRFEIRVEIPPDRRSKKKQQKKRRKIRLVLAEETAGGDRLPDNGTLVYKYPKKKKVGPTKAISVARTDDDAIRLLGFNVERSTIGRERELYGKLLALLEPDILAFQEITLWTARQTEDFVASILPPPTGGQWHSFQVADTVVVSAFPIVASATIDANQVVHVDLPDDQTPHDLVLFNAHPPCCNNDLERDREVDNLMQTWKDLLEGNGPFPIDANDAVIVTGDFNLVGFRRQFDALVHGVFTDPTKGSFSPGRDNGSLAVAPLRHSHRRQAFTWRRAESSFTPGRLDYIFYSDDVAELVKSFVLATDTMPAEALEELGLSAEDSLTASDHLPLVADFVFAKD